MMSKSNTRRKNRRRASRVKNRKYKRSIKMMGGTLDDLMHADASTKTIILMGEEHTFLDDTDQSRYNEVEEKQKRIIDLIIQKFNDKRIVFYSEAPHDMYDQIMIDKKRHSSRVIQYANTKIPIQLSSITSCVRESHGMCDELYASEMLKIIENFDCMIVQIGLFHVPDIKEIIQKIDPHVKIVIINTVSSEMLKRSKSYIDATYPKLTELLKTEPPYKLPTYIAKVVVNVNGDDVYECPLCKALSSPAAIFVNDASYFIHQPGCINDIKIPTPMPRPAPATSTAPPYLNARDVALLRIQGLYP